MFVNVVLLYMFKIVHNYAENIDSFLPFHWVVLEVIALNYMLNFPDWMFVKYFLFQTNLQGVMQDFGFGGGLTPKMEVVHKNFI